MSAVAALDRPTRDVVITAPSSAIRLTLRRLDLPEDGTTYVTDHQITEVARSLGRDGFTSQEDFGGTASNAIYNLGLWQLRSACRHDLFWYGPAASRWTAASQPLDPLRLVSVKPTVSGSEGVTVALCLIDSSTRTPVSVLVHRATDVHIEEAWAPPDILIVGLDCLARVNRRGFDRWIEHSRLAVIVDNASLPRSTVAALLRKYSAQVSWLFSNRDEANQLDIWSSVAQRGLAQFELVVTDGDRPTEVISGSAAKRYASLEAGPIANTLGAGDSYAAVYLAERLAGSPPRAAHEKATRWTLKVLGSDSARLPPPSDLNRIFGGTICRASTSRCEGALAERIHRAPATTVITGGQTGVDQIALAVGDRMGLPTVAIMPDGRRTDPAAPDTSGIPPTTDVIELSSASFRFRTWANAYISDGTLLWDLGGGEGSQATRDACASLGRPLLDLTAVSPHEQAGHTVDWARQHAVRVINVAGSRARLLPPDATEMLNRQITSCVAALAQSIAEPGRHLGERHGSLSRWVRWRPWPEAPAARPSMRRPVIGVMDNGSLRSAVEKVIGAPIANCSLIVETDSAAIAFARPRELPRMLAEGVIDVALGPSDVFGEEGLAPHILCKTGLFATALGIVRPARESSERALLGDGHLVSQYPRLARAGLRSLGSQRTIVSITGSAETWLACDGADAAVDTWKTGRHARAARLALGHAFGISGLVVACRPGDVLDKAATDVASAVIAVCTE